MYVRKSIDFFFFFQAEDGIRDGRVTGVQTCALPISRSRRSARPGACSGAGGGMENLRPMVRHHRPQTNDQSSSRTSPEVVLSCEFLARSCCLSVFGFL